MDKIKVLRSFKKYEDEFYSYLSNLTPELKDNLEFYIVPKIYIKEFYEIFSYTKNVEDLDLLNTYADSSTIENKIIAKDLINNIIDKNYAIFKYNVGLKKINNIKLIEEKTKDKNYIFKLNEDGLFIPLSFNIWDKFKRYYNCDITLKREGFINNGEIFVKTEKNRIDSFFIHRRTGDTIYHFCFIIKDFFFLDKLALYFRKNSVKTFLDKLNIKHVGDEIEIDKFKIIERQIPPDILDLENHQLYIVFLDNYNFHNEEKKNICYIKKDLKKSIMSFSNDSTNTKTDSNINFINNDMDSFTANNKMNINYYSNNYTFNNMNNNINCNFNMNNNNNIFFNSTGIKRRFSNDPNDQNIIEDFRKEYENNLKNNPIKSYSLKNIDNFYNSFKNNSDINLNNTKSYDNKNESTNETKRKLENEKDQNKVSISLGYMSIGETSKNNISLENTNIFNENNSNMINLSYIKIENIPNINNSLLQCFLNIQKIKNFFSNLGKEKTNINNNNILYLIYRLVNEININGQNINFYLEKINQYLNKYEYDINRPKKLLKLILDHLHKDNLNENENNMTDKIEMTGLEAFDNFIKNKFKTSEISKLYTGICKKTLSCTNCKKNYYKFKTFKVISIDIDSYKDESSYINFKNKLNYNNNNFTKEIESKTFYCFNCIKNKFLVKKNIYNLCPEVLIICFDKKSENVNNSFFVDLILELDLNKYIENKNSKNDYKYILNSFIEYNIKQVEYISYMKYNNVWIMMNKGNTIEININNMKKIINPQILFYEKI